MALVDYDSDSDSEQQPTPQSVAKQQLPAVQDEAGSDDEEAQFDPNDAFGISRIAAEEQRAAAPTSKQLVAQSAPEVLVQVSSSSRSLWISASL